MDVTRVGPTGGGGGASAQRASLAVRSEEGSRARVLEV